MNCNIFTCKYNRDGACKTSDHGMCCSLRKKTEWQDHDAALINNTTHPSHYTQGGIECIEAIKASMSKEAFAGYCKGNTMKYLWRYKHKNGVEDLRKANQYLKWLEETEDEKGKSET